MPNSANSLPSNTYFCKYEPEPSHKLLLFQHQTASNGFILPRHNLNILAIARLVPTRISTMLTIGQARHIPTFIISFLPSNCLPTSFCCPHGYIPFELAQIGLALLIFAACHKFQVQYTKSLHYVAHNATTMSTKLISLQHHSNWIFFLSLPRRWHQKCK